MEPQENKTIRIFTGVSHLYSMALLLWWFAGMVVAPVGFPKFASIVLPPVGMYYAMEKALCVGKIVECLR
jgi:hypothetical protein